MSWLENDYDSPSTDFEFGCLQHEEKIINAVKDEFSNGKNMVRLNFIIKDKLNLFPFPSDLIEILYALEQTGNFTGELIKFKGEPDIIIKMKPWRERHRYLEVGIITSIGVLVGYLLTRLLHL